MSLKPALVKLEILYPPVPRQPLSPWVNDFNSRKSASSRRMIR